MADWNILSPHYERGAMILVASSIDLVEAAIAVALDDVETVKAWMDGGELVKATEAEVADLQQEPAKKKVEFLIIQPYVLIQKIKLSS